MSKIRPTIRSIAQKNSARAKVISVMVGKANVRLSGSGRPLHGLNVIGGPVSPGDTVNISYKDGIPYVEAAGTASAPSSAVSVITRGSGGDSTSGTVDPLSGTGWVVDDSDVIYNSDTYIYPTGKIVLGTGDNIIKLDAQDSTYRIWAGDAVAATAPFSVTKLGELKSISGTIANWTISEYQLSADSNNAIINAGTSPYIRLGTGTLESDFVGFWVGKSGSDYLLKLGDETGDHIEWTGSSLDIVGTVTITDGADIAGWIVTDPRLHSGTGSNYIALDSGGSDPAIFAGEETVPLNAPFYVTHAGVLHAQSGDIAGWTLSTTSLTAGSGSTYVGIDNTGTNPAFYAGDATPSAAPFRVTMTGDLHAENATITGVITATSGEIGGWTVNTTNITAGASTITLDSGTPALLIGNADGFLSGEGIFMGKSNGFYKMHIGDPDGTWMDYDSNTGKLHVNGMVVVADETIATIGGRIVVSPTTQLVLAMIDTTTNIVLNPGFETSGGGGSDVFANWVEAPGTGGAITKDTTYYHNGLASCKLVQGTADCNIYQDFDVTPERTYAVTFWTRGDGVNDGRYKFRDVTHSTDIGTITSTGVTGTSFQEIKTSVTTPTGCTNLRIYFYPGATSTWYAYFDDADIYLDTITVVHNEMETGDKAYLSNWGEEWIEILTDYRSDGNGHYEYDVRRDLAGTGLQKYDIGDAVVNSGVTGDGYIDLYSTNSLRADTQYGPTIQGNIRYGEEYDEVVECWALGNLKGMYGNGTDKYGSAFGRYENGYSFITIDDTNGISMHYLSGDVDFTVSNWDAYGNLIIGRAIAGQGNVYITSSGIQLRTGSTSLIHLDSSGNASFGQVATDYSNIYWNSSNQHLEFRGGTEGEQVRSYIDTDGSFVMNVPTSWDTTYSLSFQSGSTVIGEIGASDNGSSWVGMQSIVYPQSGMASYNYIRAETPSGGYAATVNLVSKSGSTAANIQITASESGGAQTSIYLTAEDVYLGGYDTPENIYYGGDGGKFVSWQSTGLQWDTWPINPSGTFYSSTDFDGDGYSSTGGSNVQLYLQSKFYNPALYRYVPAGCKGVFLMVSIKDSAYSDTVDSYIAFADSSTSTYYVSMRAQSSSSKFTSGTLFVPCGAGGDIWYKIQTTGTMYVYIQVVGLVL